MAFEDANPPKNPTTAYKKPKLKININNKPENDEHNNDEPHNDEPNNVDMVFHEEEEVKYKPEIFNLSEKLIEKINDFMRQEASAGVTMWDEKAKKEKKINKSLWARDLFERALEEAGYVPTPPTKRRNRS